MCVIFNPNAARGRAKKRMAELQRLLGDRADFQPTQNPRHAVELALKAAQAGFPVVAAAGGDGTVHEVANGLLRSGRPDVTFAVFPIGSANDYAFTLGLSLESGLDRNTAPRVRPMDVGIVRAETGRECYFINSLGLGFSGMVTEEARRIRWLQGMALYGLAFVRVFLFRYAYPSMEIAIDQEIRRLPTFSLTVAIGKREGNLMVTPEAIPDDGLFDFLHVGAISRRDIVRYSPRLATGQPLPADHPALWMGRCREVRVQADGPLTVHVDGELFCLPPDGIRRLNIRMLPGLLRVQG
jgi:diacylglycerol kinase family enzyme